MGKGGAGKTSMRSIIFENNVARKTRELGPTSKPNALISSLTLLALILELVSIESSDVQFLGNLSLNLWDCGG